MLLIRRFEQTALELRRAGKIYGGVHPYVGQEAVAVGVCSCLRRADKITTYHRGHGHSIAKGASVPRMMAELFGRRDGLCKGKGGSMHVVDSSVNMLGANGIVGAGIPHAVGVALGEIMLDSNAVAVSFFGDGATGQGVLYESLNIAALARLPVIFVCDNNQYSGPTPINQVLARSDIAGLADAFGIPAYALDGTDVVAVRNAAAKAVDRARTGNGPTFLECKSYRWGVHAQRGTELKESRPPDELAAARASDPIMRLRSRCLKGRILTAAAYRKLQDRVDREVADAVVFAENSPFPEPKDATADLFASIGDLLHA